MLEKILAAITTQYAIHFSLIKLFKNTDRFDFFRLCSVPISIFCVRAIFLANSFLIRSYNYH